MVLNKKAYLGKAAVLLLALTAFAGVQMYQNMGSVDVPAGAAIRVSLDHSISSASSRAGDSFSATVTEPVLVDGKTVIPAGARAQGTLIGARESGRLSGRAYLQLALTSVEVNGERYDVNTTSISRVGGSHKKRNWGWIGGGAAGGTVIGALAGGGKGALIGGPVGAGAGLAVAAITGKKNTGFRAEQEITFRLTEPISVRPS